MYFNNKNDTSIDNEFNEGNNVLSLIKEFFSKYNKIFLISVVVIISLIAMVLLFANKKIDNYLMLEGEEIVTIYKGTDYIEPGYKAYNSKNVDLTNKVVIESNLNNDVIGEYEITYKISDIIKVRYVNVIEKPKDYVFIHLTSIDNKVDVYLQKGENYKEPGYTAFSTTGIDLTSKVVVSGKVDTSKKGIYKLTYSVVDFNGVTISASRKIIVMDSDINITLNTEEYINSDVTINVYVVDEYFDYMILPDNTKVTMNTYSYKVSSNGTYIFKIYNKKGNVKESSIVVQNIDKTVPSGSCMIDQDENGSFISIKASDISGIMKYVYNNKDYSNNKINLTTSINDAIVKVYDKAGNSKDIKCEVVPKLYISNISNDGVIVTINTKKINKEISGYYFSYTNKRPDKNTGGYLATNNESVDVVRLPGTTYVWVEDTSGKISEVKTITLSEDVLLNTSKYKKLTGKRLDVYLEEQGWSIEELNKLIARSVRAAGLYTKVGAATAAVSLQTVLAQKYSIKLPYWWGGKSWSFGADASWGSYKYKINDESKIEYLYYGMDCTGFTTWAYVNAGYRVGEDGTNKYPAYGWGWLDKSLDYKEENGEIGDFIASSAHVKLIVGKTDKGFVVAEASNGMMTSIQLYSRPDGYVIEKGELLMETYGKTDRDSYPSGF